MKHPPEHYKTCRCYKCGKSYPVGGQCCIEYHTSVAEAAADGWIQPYEGTSKLTTSMTPYQSWARQTSLAIGDTGPASLKTEPNREILGLANLLPVKVLMLDIDGVLNRCGHSSQGLESDKVELLDKIIRETGCRVVLISTWRKMPSCLDRIHKMLNSLGHELYGCTPVFPDRRYDQYHKRSVYQRAEEIQDWLSRHPEVTNFVTLDDDNSEATPNPVDTKSCIGLTPEVAETVISRLIRLNESEIKPPVRAANANKDEVESLP